MTNVVLVTYSEIGLKGANRADFESALVENIKQATGSEDASLRKARGRIYLSVQEGQASSVCAHLGFVFGVNSSVPAYQTEKTKEAMIEAGERILAENGGNTFKVDIRRADKQFAGTSEELNREFGERMLTAFPDRSVRMDDPDETVVVEIRPEGVFVYGRSQREHGPGGLPVGTGGSALALLSGGIDSPVAAWYVMRRGVAVDAVYFHSPPFTGEKAREKACDIARVLARYRQGPVRVFVVPFTDIQKEITARVPEEYWTVLFRRSMHRIAERVAQRENHEALITGDNLAQVASQTLANLAAIDACLCDARRQAASRVLVLRPLVGSDKQETITRARAIGTYDLSIQPYEDCCTVFTPKNPKTRMTAHQAAERERHAAYAPLEEEAITRTESLTIAP